MEEQIEISFNKIYIIESLTKNNTGCQLYEYLSKNNTTTIAIEYCDIENVEEFYQLLENICNKASQGELPLLHFELHGHQSNMGLLLKSGELVLWHYLYTIFKEININTKNNLVIVLASCHGGHIMRTIKPNDRCPWALLFGSFQRILEDKIFNDFKTFYMELIKNLNFNSSLKKLIESNPEANYQAIDAIDTFNKSVEYFYKIINSDESIRQKSILEYYVWEKNWGYENLKYYLNTYQGLNVKNSDEIKKWIAANYKKATESNARDFERFFFFWK